MTRSTNIGVINYFFAQETATNRAGSLESTGKLLLSEGRVIARQVGEKDYLIVYRNWGITRSGKLHATALYERLGNYNQLHAIKFASSLDLVKSSKDLIDREQAKKLDKIEQLRHTSFRVDTIKIIIVGLQKRIASLGKLGSFDAIPNAEGNNDET